MSESSAPESTSASPSDSTPEKVVENAGEPQVEAQAQETPPAESGEQESRESAGNIPPVESSPSNSDSDASPPPPPIESSQKGSEGGGGDHPQAGVQPAQFNPIATPTSVDQADIASIDLLMDVPMRVTVELGRTQLSVEEVLDLQGGSVVELDRIAGDPVDVFINDRIIAKGEVVVVDDRFGVRITELVFSNRGSGRQQ